MKNEVRSENLAVASDLKPKPKKQPLIGDFFHLISTPSKSIRKINAPSANNLQFIPLCTTKCDGQALGLTPDVFTKRAVSVTKRDDSVTKRDDSVTERDDSVTERDESFQEVLVCKKKKKLF